MEIFENKVGRPTNEILKKRKIFYASIVATIVFVIGGTVLLFKSINSNNLKGSASIWNSSIKISNQNITISSYQNYELNFTLNGPSGEKTYYRWFTYNNDSTSGEAWHKGTCASFTKNTTYKPKLDVTKTNPKRSGKVRIYKDEAQCKSDGNGTGSYVLEKKVSVVYSASTTTKNNTTKNVATTTVKSSSSSGSSFLKRILSLFKIFGSSKKKTTTASKVTTTSKKQTTTKEIITTTTTAATTASNEKNENYTYDSCNIITTVKNGYLEKNYGHYTTAPSTSCGEISGIMYHKPSNIDLASNFNYEITNNNSFTLYYRIVTYDKKVIKTGKLGSGETVKSTFKHDISYTTEKNEHYTRVFDLIYIEHYKKLSDMNSGENVYTKFMIGIE